MKFKLAFIIFFLGILQLQSQSRECESLTAQVVSQTCGPNGSVTIKITGGSPGYQGPGNQVALGYFIINGLDVSTHTLTFTDSERCQVEVTFYMPECGCEDLKAQVASKSCGPDGFVNISVTGGSLWYEGPGWQIFPGYFVINGLGVGSHTLTYTDSEGCEVEVTVTIEECCKNLKADLWSLSCGPNGTAKVWVSGGLAPYSGPGTQVGISGNFIINGLSVGTHTLTFTDRTGCEVKVTFYMPKCGCENLKAEVKNVTCGANSTAVVLLTGGTAPYSTTYSGSYSQIGAPGNFVIQGLAVGTHTLRFIDGKGCEIDVTFTVYNNNNFKATESGIFGCAPNGGVRIELTGGSAPYSGPGSMVTPNAFVISGLAAGNHTFVYTDNNGCKANVTVTIQNALELASIVVTGKSNCSGTGSATITVTGGTAPYRFEGTISNTGIFYVDNLPVGANSLVFFDNAGCFVNAEFIINHDGLGTCEQFTFERDHLDNTSIDLYQESFVSEISAKIYVSLRAYTVPDSIRITVNGNEVVSFSAGSDGCDGPSPSIVIDSFCVSLCDVVEFNVFGNICPLEFTAWDLMVTCEENCGLDLGFSSDNLSNRSMSKRSTDRYFEELSFNSIHTPRVSPNPAFDVLNIAKINPWFGFQELRIINSNGKVVHNQNVSNLEQINIDLKSFPSGVYMIEMKDKSGYVYSEKFVKLE